MTYKVEETDKEIDKDGNTDRAMQTKTEKQKENQNEQKMGGAERQQDNEEGIV